MLQEREFERLGSNKVRTIDVRVVAATNVVFCGKRWSKGTFREDLYYRLNVMPINIPPLQRREEDIPFLADFFVKKLATEMASPWVKKISDDAMVKLVNYHWPGNVRELQNVIERSLVLATQRTLEASDIKLEAMLRSKAASGWGTSWCERFSPRR